MKIGFINGKIYASFYPVRIYNSMVTEGDKIVFLGEDNEAKKISEKIVDLQGKSVMPGFIDAHMHLDELGQYLNILDLRGIKSIKELKVLLMNYAKDHEGPIMGHGWDEEKFQEKRWPNKYDIDEIVKDRPVILTRVCLHAAVVNSNLIEKVNYHIENENYPFENGEPLGIVKEDAFEEYRKYYNLLVSAETKKKYILDGIQYLKKNGITSIGFVSCSKETFDILKVLYNESKIEIRIMIYTNPDALQDFKDNDLLKINGIKLFVDGALGVRTALLSEKYADSNNIGEMVNDFDTLLKFSKLSEAKNKQIAVHAIGDKGIDIVLDIFSKVKGNHRIEHCSIMRADQLERIRSLNVSCVVQPHFIITDFWSLDRVGVKRAPLVYRFKDMLSSGLNVAFSTDAPVEPINPWLTVYAAVTRGKYENIELSKYTMNQALSISEALFCYTNGSAIALNNNEIGSLNINKFADFIILDKDPFNIPEKDLKDIKILATYISGKKVFES
ncbi:MAG: amidohydrolase [Thermoplasmata archaeon]